MASEQVCKSVPSLSFFLCCLVVTVDVAGNVTRLSYGYWTVNGPWALAAEGYFLSTVAAVTESTVCALRGLVGESAL